VKQIKVCSVCQKEKELIPENWQISPNGAHAQRLITKCRACAQEDSSTSRANVKSIKKKPRVIIKRAGRISLGR